MNNPTVFITIQLMLVNLSDKKSRLLKLRVNKFDNTKKFQMHAKSFRAP